MLQDIEYGRAPEIDALVGSVSELGQLTRTPTPRSISAIARKTDLDRKTMRNCCSRLRVSALTT